MSAACISAKNSACRARRRTGVAGRRRHAHSRSCSIACRPSLFPPAPRHARTRSSAFPPTQGPRRRGGCQGPQRRGAGVDRQSSAAKATSKRHRMRRAPLSSRRPCGWPAVRGTGPFGVRAAVSPENRFERLRVSDESGRCHSARRWSECAKPASAQASAQAGAQRARCGANACGARRRQRDAGAAQCGGSAARKAGAMRGGLLPHSRVAGEVMAAFCCGFRGPAVKANAAFDQ